MSLSASPEGNEGWRLAPLREVVSAMITAHTPQHPHNSSSPSPTNPHLRPLLPHRSPQRLVYVLNNALVLRTRQRHSQPLPARSPGATNPVDIRSHGLRVAVGWGSG